jgi:hypothetical protein
VYLDVLDSGTRNLVPFTISPCQRRGKSQQIVIGLTDEILSRLVITNRVGIKYACRAIFLQLLVASEAVLRSRNGTLLNVIRFRDLVREV